MPSGIGCLRTTRLLTHILEICWRVNFVAMFGNVLVKQCREVVGIAEERLSENLKLVPNRIRQCL